MRHEIVVNQMPEAIHTWFLPLRLYPMIFSMNMSSAKKVTTVRIHSRTLKRVDGLAKAMSRSRTWLIRQAVERYLDYEEWFFREVREGLKEAKAGKLIEHETVANKWGEKLEAPMDRRRQPRS
jgi:RHH-type transcriptional regulator, rel operon repressor / antitoxin RelB